MKTALLRVSLALAASALSGAAHAHPAHGGNDIVAGLLHPLLGIDHLLAMLAVGMWAAQSQGTARQLLPASFILVMGASAAAALAGVALPVLELGVAGSVLLAGLLLAFRVRMGPAAGACVAGLFAVFHGYAHGAELPAHATVLSYFAGFLLASAALLFAGSKLGERLARWHAGPATAGALLAACGGWMLGGMA